MKYATPYLRFIHISQRFFNRQPTMAYDCRLLYILSGTGTYTQKWVICRCSRIPWLIILPASAICPGLTRSRSNISR